MAQLELNKTENKLNHFLDQRMVYYISHTALHVKSLLS